MNMRNDSDESWNEGILRGWTRSGVIFLRVLVCRSLSFTFSFQTFSSMVHKTEYYDLVGELESGDPFNSRPAMTH